MVGFRRNWIYVQVCDRPVLIILIFQLSTLITANLWMKLKPMSTKLTTLLKRSVPPMESQSGAVQERRKGLLRFTSELRIRENLHKESTKL